MSPPNRGRRYLSVIQNALDCPWNPEDLSNHPLHWESLGELRDAICSFYDDDDAPTLSDPDELIPYLSMPALLSGKFAELGRPLDHFPVDQNLITALLFSHRVVIDDPIHHVLRPRGRGITVHGGSAPEELRDYLVSLYDWLPLIERDIVILKPQRLEPTASFQSIDRAELRRVLDGLVVEMRADDSRFDPDHSDHLPDAHEVARGELLSLTSALDIVQNLGSSVVPFFNEPRTARRFDAFLRSAASSEHLSHIAPRQTVSDEARHQAFLENNLVLNPEAITARDIVSIRLNNELFASWRQIVSESIDAFKAFGADETSLQDFSRRLSARANAWYADAEKKLQGTLLDARALRRSVYLVFGVWAATGKPVGAAASFLLGLLYDVGTSRANAPIREATRSHYLSIGTTGEALPGA